MRGWNTGGLYPLASQPPQLFLPPRLPLCAVPHGHSGREEMEDSSGLETSNCFLSTEKFSKSQIHGKGIQWRGAKWGNNP